MVLRSAAFLMTVMCLSAPAQAFVEDANAPEAAADSAGSAASEDKIICRGKREANTGSNMRGGRDCRKASEWKEREVAAKRELQRLQDKQQTHGQNLGR